MKDTELLLQKPLVDSFLNQSSRPLSSYSFINIFAWCDFFEFEFKMINNSLCIFAHQQTGAFLYLPPLKWDLNLATIQEAFKHMAQGKTPRAINRIENIPENLLSAFEPGHYNQYIKPVEYVYCKADLMALKGNAYKSQRHDCNCFLKSKARCSFEPYTAKDFEACLKLYELWADNRVKVNRDDIYLSMLQENARVHARLLKFQLELGLIARVLKSDGKMIGYTFGYVLDEETFCIYAEIADLTITGSAAYMFRSFCADAALEKFKRINTMDDFGMPNVALAKKAYHPSELLVSYNVSLKT